MNMKPAQAEDGGRPSTRITLRDDHSVFAGRRIVVIAEQQDLVGGRADFVVRKLPPGPGGNRAACIRFRRNSARSCLPGVSTMMPLAWANCLVMGS